MVPGSPGGRNRAAVIDAAVVGLGRWGRSLAESVQGKSRRLRIIRQSLVETLLLSIFGGALGLALAFVATRALIAFVTMGANFSPLSPTRTLGACTQRSDFICLISPALVHWAFRSLWNKIDTDVCLLQCIRWSCIQRFDHPLLK